MRMIEADKVIPLVRLLLLFHPNAERIIEDMQDVVDSHTIEAEPVRHGRWAFEEDEVHPWLTKAICSNCEKVAEKSSHLQFRIGKKTFLHDHNYCPNCGAKMRGDTDE